jgi:cell division transport system permease protein
MMRAAWCCMKGGCIFMIERDMTERDMTERNMTDPSSPGSSAPRKLLPGALLHAQSPIVPKDSISGRALVAVVAIMTFLASLTAGAVMLVRANASTWQSEVGREVTVQVRPIEGRDIEADAKRAVEILRGAPGIAEARLYSREESAGLLEPWLGRGIALDDLPVPRLILIKLVSGAQADFAALRRQLSEALPNASLDDHRGWIGRMRAMAASVAIGGLVILLLMFAATILSVTFATRGAMAANKPIVEVLHLIGAKDSFIVGQFQRHFLMLGLKGGLIGGGGAIVLFVLLGSGAAWFSGTAWGDQFEALFGSFSIGWSGYLAILAQIVLTAIIAALTCRRTVYQTLNGL